MTNQKETSLTIKSAGEGKMGEEELRNELAISRTRLESVSLDLDGGLGKTNPDLLRIERRLQERILMLERKITRIVKKELNVVKKQAPEMNEHDSRRHKELSAWDNVGLKKGVTEMEKCLRCPTELVSDEDFLTGICPDCWTDVDGGIDPMADSKRDVI